MKKSITLLLVFINILFLTNINTTLGQTAINTPNFDYFSILSKDSLIYNSTEFPRGQVGAYQISNNSLINQDSILGSSNQLFNSAILEIDSLSRSYFLYNEPISINNLYDGITFEGGVYEFESDFLVHTGKNIRITGSPEEIIIININGKLIFEKGSYIVIDGILPENIIWNVKRDILLDENTFLYGTFISQENITIKKNVKGAINIFSFSNIIINSTEPFLPRIDLVYSSINSMPLCNSTTCTSNVDLINNGNYNNAVCANYNSLFKTIFTKICTLQNNSFIPENYTFAKNAKDWNNDWVNLYDHTPNATNGYFLLYDGFSTSTSDKVAWSKTLSFKKGTSYKFYFYLANPNRSGTSGQLKISCSATKMDPVIIQIPNYSEGWKLFCYEFTTTAEANVNLNNCDIMISQTNTFGQIGWDFALDDIQLYETGPPAVVTVSDDLNNECNSGQIITLTASVSPSVPVQSYIWYKWINNKITQIPNVNGNTYIPTETGNYRVKCHFYGNCYSAESNWIYVAPPPTANANNYVVQFNNNYLPSWTSSNNPFNSPVIVINSEFRVKSGVNLTLKGLRFEFGPNAKFIIEAGATVTLESNNSTPTILTSYNCPNNMWQGVELVTSLIDEIPHNGRIIVKNNCVIENARIGINNNVVGFRQNVDYYGYVNAEGAIFRNNYISVNLNSSRSISRSNISKLNRSTFKNCTFINNAPLKDIIRYSNGLPKAHIELQNVRGIKFEGNIFENSFYTTILTNINGVYDEASLKLNKGINAINSNYIFSGTKENEFRNLWIGIEHLSMDISFQAQKFNNIKFLSNVYGLILRGGSYISIERNSFALSNSYPEGSPIRLDRNYIGINARGCNNLIIKENNFSNLYCGIVTVDLGKNKMQRSLITSNIFNNVGREIKSKGQGIYSLYNNTNTQFRCNEFKATLNNSITNHWVVNGIISSQGSCKDFKSPSSNRYETEPVKSDILIYNLGQAFAYFTHNTTTEIITPIMKSLPNYNNISNSFVIGCGYEYNSNSCSSIQTRDLSSIIKDIDDAIENQPNDSNLYDYVIEALKYYAENDSLPDSKIDFLKSLPLEEFKWVLVSEYLNNQKYSEAYEQLSILNIESEEHIIMYQYYHFLIDKFSHDLEINDFNEEDSVFLSNIANSEYAVAYEAQSLMTYLFNSTYSIPLPYDVESSLIIADTNKRSINADNKIIVSPNPTSKSITIKSSNLPIKRFSLSDLNGRVIISSENLNNTMLDINVDFLENGMYFVIISDTDNITHVERLIIDKK